MTDTHTERAFEAYVEATLLERGGWQRGTTAEWDVERALFPARVRTFLEATQPELWAEMRALHAAGLDDLVIEALVKELAVKGTLHVLRHGFKCYGKTFRLAAFKPAHALNDAALARYERNVLTVTRQVPCHPGRRDTVDLLLALNGLPVATCELKNPGTGQTWRHAVRQYREDRDPRAAVRLQDARAGALRRGPERGAHEHPPARGRDALPAVQPREPAGGRAVRRRESAPRIGASDRLFLGRRLAPRQRARHPRPLHVRRNAGGEP